MKITDDMLSAQAAEARELWLQACTPDALPEHRFSRKFRREMRRLLRAQKHSAAFNRSLRLARRTAAVLLLSAAVSFGCAMSVEAYRVSLINTVVRVFNDLTDYRFSSALPSETDSKAFTPPVLFDLPDTMHKTDEHSTPNGYTVTYESTTDFSRPDLHPDYGHFGGTQARGHRKRIRYRICFARQPGYDDREKRHGHAPLDAR